LLNVELQVVGWLAKFWFIRNKGSTNHHEQAMIKQEIDKAIEWYNKKDRYYEMKEELQSVIRKRNEELRHVKRKLNRTKERFYHIMNMYPETSTWNKTDILVELNNLIKDGK
jgi:K+/H+ antiporter YhaU regulatory subunit KhtT